MPREDIFRVSGTTPAQRDRWRAAAGGGPRDLSAFVRASVDRAALDPVVEAAKERTLDGVARALIELRASLGSGPGNALNQVARALNTDIRSGTAPNPAPHESAMAGAYLELQAIRAAVNAALDRLADLPQ